MKRWVAHACTALMVGMGGQAHALFYDPFPDGGSVKPADELEQRIWDEAEATRGQFIRGEPSAEAQALARHSQKLLKRHWPDLVDKIRIAVVDNADVFALSSANGDVIISTGMFLRMDDDAELAAVIGREIGHVMKRHAVRTVYVARLGAGASTVFQSAVNASSFMGTVSVLSSFQVLPEMLLADGGKALLQSQLSKIRDNMADNFLRRMSATGFEAMVKTSLFGYSESLEEEADEFALSALLKAYGSTDAFKHVMQRLASEAAADEKKFSAFYGNETRMKARLAFLADFEKDQRKRSAKVASPPSASEQPKEVNPKSADALQPLVSLPVDAIELDGHLTVASVVVGELSEDVEPAQRPLGEVLPEPTWSYAELIARLALPVAEAEMDAGHLGRLSLNIDRTRPHIDMPKRLSLILAEALTAMADPKQVARGEALATSYAQAHPEDARALKLLGQIQYRKGQIDEAERLLTRALELAESPDERGFIEQYLKQAQKKKAMASS